MTAPPLSHPLALHAGHLFAAFILAAWVTRFHLLRRVRQESDPPPSDSFVPLLWMFLPACLIVSLVLGPLSYWLRGSAAEIPVSVAAALAAAAPLGLLWSRRQDNCYTVFVGPPLAFVTAWFTIAAVAAAVARAL